MKIKTSFSQLYSFVGFRAKARFKSGILGDPKARIVSLEGRQKKRYVHSVVIPVVVSTIIGCIECVILIVEIIESIWSLSTAEWTVVNAHL